MSKSASYKLRSRVDNAISISRSSEKQAWKLSPSLYQSFLMTVLFTVVAAMSAAAVAQVPVGTISGTVIDPSDAVIPNATIIIKNKATSAERRVESHHDGAFSAPLLPVGVYEVSAQAKGFRTLVREADVSTGSIVTVEMKMEIGNASEIVTVEGAQSQINYESHSVDGIITRQKIQDLPLNGRSFLQLAFLEPGVTVSPGTTSQYNSLFSVSVLGGGTDKTAITVDGGTVRNSIEGQTGMNFSQEVIQEFQLSSTNFDLSTGITSVGSVNIVTRNGGNEFHGSGYFFFRDHNMAAYPALSRNPLNPDPFFARRNPGVWIGGPIIKNRLFFFSNYEYTNQSSVISVQPNLPSAAGLTGNFSNPYRGHLFSTRLDLKITDKHSAFLRYSHDQNKGFGPSSGAPLPSAWLQNKNFSDQGVFGVSSTFTPTLVNDFRFNYTYWQNRNLFPDDSVCPNCVGLGLGDLSIDGTNVRVGNTSNATQGRDLRRYTFIDNLTWQKSTHRIRFGTELEHAPGTGFWGFCDPYCNVAFSPEFMNTTVRPLAGPLFPLLFPTLPTTIRTTQDFLNLPFAGASAGVGDPSQPPPYNIDKAKVNNRMRFYGQDTWKIAPSFTLNYGLAWSFESTVVNRDLDKPRYLAPLIGNDLSPTDNNYKNFSPSLGFAWNVDRNNKTVVRGGGGIYYDTEQLYRRLSERAAIGPVGNGRILVPHTAFTNIFPGIFNLNTGQPVPVGASLPPAGIITNLTVGQFQQIYNQQIGAIRQRLTPTNLNDLSVRNIQLAKSTTDLYPDKYPVQRGYHMSLGIQRDLGHDMVLSADLVRRVFVNTLLGSLDYNRYDRYINGVQTPVIPRCTSTAQQNDPNAQCSTGAITFWTPGGRQVYNALLLKLDKRFSKRYLFTASYALTAQRGVNGVVDMDDWFRSWGPQGSRHILNLSGIVDLPWGFQLGVISAMSTKGPLTPTIGSLDLDGDGSGSEPLPMVKGFNCINRNCGKSDLATAVQNWNASYYPSGPPILAADFKKDARGRNIPFLTLPTDYRLGDNFSSQDVRVTKKFAFGEDRLTISVFAEMFNVFNRANLGGYNFNLTSGAAFGQPTNRASQVFGSGGPRALQLGGRLTF